MADKICFKTDGQARTAMRQYLRSRPELGFSRFCLERDDDKECWHAFVREESDKLYLTYLNELECL